MIGYLPSAGEDDPDAVLGVGIGGLDHRGVGGGGQEEGCQEGARGKEHKGLKGPKGRLETPASSCGGLALEEGEVLV